MLTLLALVSGAAAFSTGLIDICNAKSPIFGCNNHKNGDRLQCQEPGQEMYWALKPVTDNTLFELFAGDESAKATSFTPGRAIKISLRTKKYDLQYNGLLLYAIDAADASADPVKVGRWEFTDTEDRFHSFCPGTVLHGSAVYKPYLTSWRFFPPASFTGRIKFIGLIKTGPANDGAFFYPNELTLSPTGTPPTLTERWFRGANNRSCDETCTAVNANLRCSAARLASINTAAKFEAQVAPFVTCRRPLLARCTDQGLSTDTGSGFCYYPSTAECTAAGLTVTPPTCDAVGTGVGGRRICPCDCAPGATCTAAPTPTSSPRITAATTTTTVAVVGTTTAAPGTGAPSTSSGAPVGTEAPKPVCTNKIGCQCGEKGECPSDADCTLVGNAGFCTVKKATCTIGQLGCLCNANSACDDGLECKTALKICGRKAEDMCAEGLLGCACTSSCTRTDATCKKTAASDAAGICSLQAAEQNNVCTAGTIGCPCAANKSCGDPAAGFECKLIGRNEICVDMRLFAPGGSDVTGAATVAASALVALVATLAILF